MGFRQAAPDGQHQHQRERQQKPEDRRPALPPQQPAPKHRGHCRRDAKNHRHLAHQALRIMPVQHIANHRTPHNQAHAGTQALQCAKCQQLRQRGGQCAAHRGQRKQRQPAQDHSLAAQRVGQRPVHQTHRRICQQIHADGLLHRQFVGGKLRTHLRERRENGVDRERPEHRQAAQQQGQTTRRDGGRWGHGQQAQAGGAGYQRLWASNGQKYCVSLMHTKQQAIIPPHSGRSAQTFGFRRAAEGATARNRSGPRPPCEHTLERSARRPPQTRPAPKGQEAARDPPPHPRASKLSGKRTERASLSRALRFRMPP